MCVFFHNTRVLYSIGIGKNTSKPLISKGFFEACKLLISLDFFVKIIENNSLFLDLFGIRAHFLIKKSEYSACGGLGGLFLKLLLIVNIKLDQSIVDDLHYILTPLTVFVYCPCKNQCHDHYQ
jgi:hypothetical protein